MRRCGLVDESDDILPFTGAGISTECGIRTFVRPGGLWTKYQRHSVRSVYGEFRHAQRKLGAGANRHGDTSFPASPGSGHVALASLHRRGKIPAVVTQNIDNLHQASGFAADKVVELHGNTTYATCLDCARRYELAWVK